MAAPLIRKPSEPPTDGMQKTEASFVAVGAAVTGPVFEPTSAM